MHEQMEMFENGGLKDQGGTLDPISGNEVPSGSLKEEVRDDIDAKLSPGEFVFPADVVRFIGLSSLMKMRDKAKAGLSKMEAMGQMGNSEDAILPDDVPFEMSDLIIVAEGGGGMGEADPKMDMYQGGVSRYSNGGLQEEAANKVRNDIDKLLEDVPLDKRAETIAYNIALLRNHLEPPKSDWEKQKRAYRLKYLEEQLYLAENVDLSQPPLEAADHFDKAEPIRLAQTAIDSAMLDTPASKTDSPPNVNMGSSNGRLQEKVRNDIDQQLNNMPLKERAKQNVNTDSSNIVNGGWKYKVKRDPAFESALPKPVERGEPVERVKPLINITTKTTNEPTKLSQSDSDSARLDTPPGKAIRQQMEDMGVGGEADPRVEDEDAEVTISIKDLRTVMTDAISIAKSDPDAPEFFEHPEGRPDLNKGGVLKYAEGGGGMGEADPKVDRGSELLGSNLQQYFHPETKDVKFFLMHTNPVTRQREPINPLPGYVVDTPRNRASVGKKAPTQTKPTTTKVKSELESTGEEKGVGGGSVSDVSFGVMTQSEKADFSRDTKGPFGGLISGVSDVMGGVAEMAFSPGPLGVAGAKALGTLTGTEIDTSLGFMGMPEKQRAEAAQALAEQKAMNPSELKAQRARDEEKVEKRAAEAYDDMMGAPVGTSVGAMTSQGALAVDMQTGLVTDPVDGAVIKGALEKEAHDKVGFGKDAAPTTSETYSMTGGLSDYGPDVGGEPGTRGGIDTYKGGFIPKRKKQKKMKRGGLASR